MPKWLQCTEHCWGLSNHGVFNCDVQYANFVSCVFGIDIIDSSRVSIFLQYNVIQCFRVCHCVWMSEGGFPVEVLQQSINFVYWFSTCWFDKFQHKMDEKALNGISFRPLAEKQKRKSGTSCNQLILMWIYGGNYNRKWLTFCQFCAAVSWFWHKLANFETNFFWTNWRCQNEK